MARVGRRVAAGGALVVAAAAAAALWAASSALPTRGTHVAAGLAAPVTVHRDRWGVPHVFAASEADGAFALGWLHAEDRLWQMEGMRRLVAGRLAEVFGEAALPSDRWMRTLGLYRLAERQIAGLAPETRAVLDAYAAGVNARVQDGPRPLPPEFLLLGLRPEPWRPADSLAWLKIMALRLSSDRRDDLLRARLAQRLSADQIGDLWPGQPSGMPITLAGVDRLDPGMLALLARADVEPAHPRRGASNAWAVAGGRTESGLPILANDPHLSFAVPLPWYLARIVTPERTLAGATAPGFPALVLGHNGRIAWGLTSSDVDVEDLFVERPDPTDPSRYLAPDGPVAFEVRWESIAVADGDGETLRVRSTRHGPVISDLAAVAGPVGADGGEAVLSLRAPYLLADDRTADAVIAVNRAHGWEDFRAALALATTPQQNVLYADVDGRVGFVSVGLLPVRRETGGLPVPGWTGEHDWTGFVPVAEMPATLDPAAGAIVNANNRVTPPDWRWPIRGAWDAGFRARRIEDLLALAPRHTVESAAAMQVDALSLTAQRLLPLMLGMLPPPDATGATDPGYALRAEATRLLHAWSGEMRSDRPEPLIFSAWLRDLVRSVCADELAAEFPEYWDYRPAFVERVLTERRQWCDDVTTPATEECADRLRTALDRALLDLVARHGADSAGWRWGDVHVGRFEHPLWARVPLAGRLTAIRPALDGGSDTVNRAAENIADPRHPFAAVHGAGFRAVYDLADPGRSLFVVATGQSGNPLSRHWRDQLALWRAGGGIRLDATRESLDRDSESRLELRPDQRSAASRR